MRPSVVLAARRPELLALASAQGAGRLRVFGSAAKGTDGDDSDLDLLVDLPAGTSLLRLIGLQHAIADLLGVRVDLCTERELHPALRARVLAEARAVSERDALYLSHVLAAIDDIGAFTEEGRDVFLADKKTQSAVIRQLEIIGEAVRRLSPEAIAASPSVPWRAIAGTRDRLIHGYFSVDLDAVWAMVEVDLAPLRVEVDRLLRDARFAGG